MHSTNRRLVATRHSFSEMRASPANLQEADGYAHTLAEIWQQPDLWIETASRMMAAREQWLGFVGHARAILLTGSGSSYFVGKSIAPALQKSLSIPVTAVESGELLLAGNSVLPPTRPLLVVSFARSGDSPESWGLVHHLLDEQPEVKHLLITCNPNGRLARDWGTGQDPRVRLVLLDERCCDRSLVMTSSFTCMAVAGLGLGVGHAAQDRYLAAVHTLAASAVDLLGDRLPLLEALPVEEADRMIAVGSGSTQGAAWEVALKMLEMSAGRVNTRAEGCLGLRHGPMCALQERSLFFMPLSSNPLHRAYQVDLLREIGRKRLGGWKVILGAQLPADVLLPHDVALDLPDLGGLDDEWIALAAVVAGQLLAFLRCRAEGLRPDCPGSGDAISRVVGEFTLHSVGLGVG